MGGARAVFRALLLSRGRRELHLHRAPRARARCRTSAIGVALPGGGRRPDLDAPGRNPRRERSVDRVAHGLWLSARGRAREAGTEAWRVERRRADGAPLTVP